MGKSFHKKLLITITLAAALYLAGTLWAGWREIAATLGRFQWELLPVCLALSFLNYAVRFMKWHYYLGVLKIPLAKAVSFQIFLAGLVMTATPGKFGEVFKAYLVKEIQGTPMSRTAPIILAERFTDFIAFLLMALFGITLIPEGRPVFFISVVIVLALILLGSWRRAMETLLEHLRPLPVVGARVDWLRTAYESTYRLIAPGPLAVATLISLVSWFFECLEFALVMWGFGAPIPLLNATFIYAFATIVGALLMTPGGVGPTEGALGGLLILLQKIPQGLAASATLLIRFCTLWFAVGVGLAALVMFRKTWHPGELTLEEMREAELSEG